MFSCYWFKDFNVWITIFIYSSIYLFLIFLLKLKLKRTILWKLHDGLYRASALFLGVYEPTKQKLLNVLPENLSAVAHLVILILPLDTPKIWLLSKGCGCNYLIIFMSFSWLCYKSKFSWMCCRACWLEGLWLCFRLQVLWEGLHLLLSEYPLRYKFHRILWCTLSQCSSR